MGFWSGDLNSCIWVTNQYHRHMFVWKFSSQRRTVSPPHPESPCIYTDVSSTPTMEAAYTRIRQYTVISHEEKPSIQ